MRAGLDLVPKPTDDVGVLEVFEFVSDRPTVGLLQSLEHVGQGLVASVLEQQRGREFSKLLYARAEEGRIELWVPGRLGAQGIDGRELVPVDPVGLNERCCMRDGTEKTTHLVRFLPCGAQFRCDPLRSGPCIRLYSFAIVLCQALGDDQTGIGRGLRAQFEELTPHLRYTLGVTRELLVESLGVGGVLAVERLFVHRSRCLLRRSSDGL